LEVYGILPASEIAACQIGASANQFRNHMDQFRQYCLGQLAGRNGRIITTHINIVQMVDGWIRSISRQGLLPSFRKPLLNETSEFLCLNLIFLRVFFEQFLPFLFVLSALLRCLVIEIIDFLRNDKGAVRVEATVPPSLVTPQKRKRGCGDAQLGLDGLGIIWFERVSMNTTSSLSFTPEPNGCCQFNDGGFILDGLCGLNCLFHRISVMISILDVLRMPSTIINCASQLNTHKLRSVSTRPR